MGLTRNLRDGQLVIKDGTGTPLTVTVALDEGDLRIEIPEDTREVKDRGALDHVRVGDEEACTLEFTLKFQEFIGDTSASGVTPYEALKRVGEASAWVSTRPTGERYCVDLQFTITNPAGAPHEVITCPDFFANRVSFAEGQEYNTLSVSGKFWATAPTITKSTW